MKTNLAESSLDGVRVSGPRVFIRGGWSIVLKQGATKAAYSNVSIPLVSDGGGIVAPGLRVLGVQEDGFLRIEAEIPVDREDRRFALAVAFVLGAADGADGGIVDAIEIVRRGKGGKLVSTVLAVDNNVEIPAYATGFEVVLRPEDQEILKEAYDDIASGHIPGGVSDTLHVDFVIRAPQVAVRLGLVTLVKEGDLEKGTQFNGIPLPAIGTLREEGAPAPAVPPMATVLPLFTAAPKASPAAAPAAPPQAAQEPAAAAPAAAPAPAPATPPSPPAPSIASKDLKAIDAEIGHLERALWGGYSQVAQENLLRIAKSRLSHPEARVRASWELARWFSVKGDFRQVVELLSDVRGLSKPFARRKTFRLVEINALLQVGDLETAAKRIEDASKARPDDNDYRLMGTNVSYLRGLDNPAALKETSAERLAAFNAMFEQDGLATLRVDLDKEELNINSLRCDATDRWITDGPKISVLMAAYGAEEHIHLAVESILGQTWRNLELVIVEDCSPDGTWERMQHFAALDDRVRIFRNSENQGAYITRNNALGYATGEFITVHDSDDWSHPEMLAAQMKPFLERDPEEVKATFTMMCRVTPDLRFGIRPSRRNLETVHRSYPSLLVRRSDLEEVGVWDGVRANADAEMVARLRNRFGPEKLVDALPNTPMSFFLVRPESLTEQGETSLLSLTFGVRHEYDRQVEHMRRKWEAEGVIPGERASKKEPFASPQLLLPYHMRPEPKYDMILVSDLSLLGGTRGCNLGYIDAAVAAGLRVGLFHWPRGDLRLLPDIDPAYRDRNQLPQVDIITCEEEAECDLLILHHPPVMKHMLDRFPRIVTKNGVILVNQLPYQVLGGQNSFYEPLIAERDFRRLFGVRPLWAPISTLVRRHLDEQDSGLRMTDIDWLPPINVPLRDPPPRDADRPPVIGRHARDHWTKWPEDTSLLSAAYMADTEVTVRLLGGANTPERLLSSIPENWEVLEFDSIPVLDFIDSLDFLVHFPHTQYIEEFGRNVAEAMARGVPAVLPPVFRETFHDAAIYCEPDEVGETIRRVWADKDLYMHYARAGRDFVAENCHVTSLQSRMSGFLGTGS
ncbi:glycosyltransferase family A protein [Ancylobacter oerskovii]|uniref:Glycosyltransferase n=1 Tax=Ancylobacter oerskovii TaxID=459519 RepID=A0ABW4Z187_9HYPH|nr:glycosyltransferase family A protein [Ancylobacter oerskovii]MBS7545056.1 glycosyltransferase [Ancylobacter oerskovii]